MSLKEGILRGLKETIIAGDPEAVVRLCNEAIEAGIDPVEAIEKGLVAGILVLGGYVD